MSAQHDETLLGLNTAAEKLAVSRRTVVRAIEAGDLPSIKIGRRRLIRRHAAGRMAQVRDTPRRIAAPHGISPGERDLLVEGLV